MRKDKKVQFVLFETTLAEDLFIKRWEQFKKSSNSDDDVTLQQSEKEGLFTYIAQHRLVASDLKFVFSKEERHSRVVRERIKTTQVGGYSLWQAERLDDAVAGERKFFVFLKYPHPQLDLYMELPVQNKLNIYEAYYENCRYDYILEYFVKSKFAPDLLEQLKKIDQVEIPVFKECVLSKKAKPIKEQVDYEWPK